MKKIGKNRRNIKLTMVLSIMAIIAFICFGTSAVTAKASSTSGRYKYYTTVYVDRDTTLWGIAQQYMSEEYCDTYDYIDEVIEINDLSGDTLEYGITLCVPYYSAEYK